MRGYSRLKKDIMSVRNRALLNLFVLDCTKLNAGMAEHCQQLYDSLIKHQVSHMEYRILFFFGLYLLRDKRLSVLGYLSSLNGSLVQDLSPPRWI